MVFSFPRAGVGTHFSRSHALAWERLGDAPASRNPQDAGASRIGSHAGAWEPVKNLKHFQI